MNRKVRRLALRSALSQKVIDNEMTVLDNLSLAAIKTKAMIKVLENLEASRKVLIVMDEVSENVALSARNIPGVKVIDSKGLNVYDILNSDKLVITEGAIKLVEEVLA
jgi:large subunit ribosomal protein L4